MNRKLTLAVSGILALVGMVAAFELGRRGSARPASDSASTSDVSESVRWSTPSNRSEPTSSTSSGYRPLETLVVDPTHSTVKFVSPESREGQRSMVLVGAPGIWPPATLTSDEYGVLYLPQTDIRTLTGKTFRQYELLARSTEHQLAYWGVVDFGRQSAGEEGERRRLELRESAPIRLQVEGPDGQPRDGAEVRLSRGAVGFVTLNKQTGPDGSASFRTIPPGSYVASASLAEVGAGDVEFEHQGPELTSVEIELDPSRAPQLPGEPASSEEPVNVEVRLHGPAETAWRNMRLRWRPSGREWRQGILEPTGTSGVWTWRKRVPSTPVELRVESPDGASDSRTVGSRAAEEPVDWQVDLKSTHEIYVADAYGAPVDGALVQVWRDGRRVESAHSRSTEPVALRLKRGTTYRLVAIDARRGEAARTLTAGSDPSEVTLTVDEPLFSGEIPVERLRSPERIERVLGAPLVRDGDAWILDARSRDSAARRSGLKRGDRLMSVQRREGSAWRIIVDRDGRIVEKTLER